MQKQMIWTRYCLCFTIPDNNFAQFSWFVLFRNHRYCICSDIGKQK